MKEVSLRKFQLKASHYIEELPILLTRYNKPVAIVVSPELWELVDTLISFLAIKKLKKDE